MNKILYLCLISLSACSSPGHVASNQVTMESASAPVEVQSGCPIFHGFADPAVKAVEIDEVMSKILIHAYNSAPPASEYPIDKVEVFKKHAVSDIVAVYFIHDCLVGMIKLPSEILNNLSSKDGSGI